MNIVIKLNKKFAQGIIQGGIVCLTSDYSTTATYYDVDSGQTFSYLPGFVYDEGTIAQDIDITDGPSLSNPISFDFSLLDTTGDWTQLLKSNPTIGGEVIITTDGIWGSSENVITDIVSISISNNIVSFKTEDRKRFVISDKSTHSSNKRIKLTFQKVNNVPYTNSVAGITSTKFRAYEIYDNRVDGVKDAYGIKYYNLPLPGTEIILQTDSVLNDWQDVIARLEIIDGPNKGEIYTGKTYVLGDGPGGSYLRHFYINTRYFRGIEYNNDTQLPNISPNDKFIIYKRERVYNIPSNVSLSDIESIYTDNNINLKEYITNINGNELNLSIPDKISERILFRPDSTSNDIYGNISSNVIDNSLYTYTDYETEGELNGGTPFTLLFETSRNAIKSIKNADIYLVANFEQTGQIIDHLKGGWNYQYEGVYQLNPNNTLTSAEFYSSENPYCWSIPTLVTSGGLIGFSPFDNFEANSYKISVKTDEFDKIGFVRLYFQRGGINLGNGENILRLYSVGLLVVVENTIEDNEDVYIDIGSEDISMFQDAEWYAFKQFGIWHNVYVSTDVLGSSIATLDYMIPAGRNYFPLGRDIAHDCFNSYVDFSSYAYDGLSAIGYKKQLRGVDFYQRLDEMSQNYIFNEDMLLKDSVSDLEIMRGSFINSPKIIWSDYLGVEYYLKFKNVEKVTSAFPAMSDNWKSFIDTDYDLSQLVDVETFYNNAKTAFDYFRTSFIETDLLIERDVNFVAFKDIESIFNNHATRLFRYISKIKKEITFKSNVFVSLGLRVRLNHISILGNSWLYGYITSKTYNVASRLVEYTVQIDYVTQNFDMPELIENELTYTSHITNSDDILNDQLLNFGDYDTYNGQL